MKPFLLLFSLLVANLYPLGAQAADCRAIVANTVAELKAAYPDWDDNMETLARTAAGSACVKAGNSAAAVTSPEMKERAVPASSQVAPATAAPTGTAAASSAAVATTTDEQSSEASSAEKKDDEGWNPFKDIKFNKVSASPNKKPYERRRAVNDAAPLDDSE